MQKKKNLEKCFHCNLEGFQLTGFFFFSLKLHFEFLAVFEFGYFFNNCWKVLWNGSDIHEPEKIKW